MIAQNDSITSHINSLKTKLTRTKSMKINKNPRVQLNHFPKLWLRKKIIWDSYTFVFQFYPHEEK